VTPSRNYGVGESQTRRAIADLLEGLREWRLWIAFGWLDVKQRYRRAVIGPFWITISMAVLVGALGVIYAGIFRVDIRTFLPHVATGFTIWFYFSTTVIESASTFVQSEGLIKHGGIPLSLHIYRNIFRNIVTGAHNLVVMLLVYLWQPDLLNWNVLLFIPGMVLLIANLLWISFLVGTLCTRYRDFPPIITNLLQVCFFVTPVLYRPDVLPPELMIIVEINPLHYFIEILRAPMLGRVPSINVFVAMTAFAMAGSLLSFGFFRMTRARIAYWL